MRSFSKSWPQGVFPFWRSRAREREARQVAEALAEALSSKNLGTGEHAHAVAHLAERIGVWLGLSGRELAALSLGALLHDVGKIGVPDDVLKKPRPLSEKEREAIERHPEIGAKILEPVKVLAPALPAVRHHHERWDGTGYPDGLKGEEIPLTARIVAVADAFDVMTRDRPYKRGYLPDVALPKLLRDADGRYDPRVTDALFKVLVLRKALGEEAGRGTPFGAGW